MASSQDRPCTPTTGQPAPPSELSVEWWPIERPIPYGKNPRVCPQSAIAKVAASLEQFGFRQAIVVDAQGVVVVGHTRLLAARQLGLKQVPVHIAADLSPAQARAYRIADNRTNQESSWDLELLSGEIGELASLDYDIDVLGFAADELAAFQVEPTLGLTDPDEVPEPPGEPLTQPGDLWLLGRHRLLCGDATCATDVARLMNGARACLMATDPPYGVGYDGGNHPQTWGPNGRRITAEEKTKHWDSYADVGELARFYEDYLRIALEVALGERPFVYQWLGVMRLPVVVAAWEQVGLLPHQLLIWAKSRSVLSRCDYQWNYEGCLYGWRRGRRPPSARRPPAGSAALWAIDSRIEDGSAGLHPTMKPVEVVRRPIEYHTKVTELLYEPFSGSGTAIIAAEMSGRSCYALERSPVFVDVAVRRWERFSGRQAVRCGALD